MNQSMTKNLYQEILNYSMEDLQEEEYYSIPLRLNDLLKLYHLLKQEDEDLCKHISSFLNDEYDINIQFVSSLFK